MNFKSSSWTGRSSNSMQQAFGCYTDDRLHPMPDTRPIDWSDKIVIAGCIVALLALFILAVAS